MYKPMKFFIPRIPGEALKTALEIGSQIMNLAHSKSYKYCSIGEKTHNKLREDVENL